ncbi:unnamed protein product [Clonostachys solani]|uniref:Actin-like ATPase domain-containing protein n=1 Tax=Clonostachys solani TaxID=160281 RepID=A0A9N9YSN5_9HYPO|nr:unnamed protein product [Clonostachys solani]
MECNFRRKHIFLGLDFGTTRSGAFAVHAWVCQEHRCFRVIEEAPVNKFPTKFIHSPENRIELVGPDQDVPDKHVVKNAKLEILLSDPGWFEETGDFREIQSWVKNGWQGAGDAGFAAEYFGIAIKKLYELALAAIDKSDAPKESITTVVTFPNLRDKAKDTLKIGLAYSNILSRCRDVHVGVESQAALAGLLHRCPEVAQMALAERESVIVADCGGITLDMAAFRHFDPACGGTPTTGSISVLGGGLWIDRNFERLVDRKLSELMAQISEPDHEHAKGVKSSLMIQWHSFIKERPLHPQRVFLTGGLGCSKSVRELVQRILDTKVEGNEPRMRVQDTEDTFGLWNAVAMGGAHYFDPTISVACSSWKPFP